MVNGSCVPRGGTTLPASQSHCEKEPILNLGEFHGRGAFRVIIRHMIDPGAYGIAPHQPISTACAAYSVTVKSYAWNFSNFTIR